MKDPCECLLLPEVLLAHGARCGYCVDGINRSKNDVVRDWYKQAAQIADLQRMLTGMADRIAAQSAMLSRRAEKANVQ
jgi:hypothetical protein